jgi:hypothetical protein
MQPEILRFLLLARVHLRDDTRTEVTRADHPDMQAIDRALPDADWFETLEVRITPRRGTIDLWDERSLQF